MLLKYHLFIATATLLSIKVTPTAASVIVTGVPVDPSVLSVPHRRNIVEFSTIGGPQWDLYIQALGAMQAANETDPESYFQISGIHGRPFMEYDQTGGWTSSTSLAWAGYCPHGEVIFVPWHRAYVALFEQILVAHAKTIAMTYPEEHRPVYIEAADTLRAPFWDWATDEAVPQSTVPETISITVPENGQLASKYVENPLYTFHFPKSVQDGAFGVFERNRIYRCDQPNMTYPDSANRSIKHRQHTKHLYDIFTRSTDFEDFVTFKNRGSSLEGLHGSIHWDAACQGQFLSVAYTGFDPLFMLHHSNVDRLWAYWQAMHPDQQIFTGEHYGFEKWGTPDNSILTTQSPLLPFRRSETEFHTSESVLSIHDLGYSYHGLESKDKSAEDRREEVTRIINNLEPGFLKLGARAANGLLGGPRAVLTRYFAHIAVEASEIERPCSIEVSMNGTYAGNLVLLSMPDSGIVRGEISLDTIQDTLRGKPSRVVLNTFETALKIDIIKGDGSRIALADVPNLDVQIEQVRVAAPRWDTELPEYSESRMFGVRLVNAPY